MGFALLYKSMSEFLNSILDTDPTAAFMAQHS